MYATLSVRLSHSGVFSRHEWWKNASTYKAIVGRCGFLVKELEEGKGELALFFTPEASDETRVLFETYVHQHLLRRALPDTVTRRRINICSNCGLVVTDQMARLQLERGVHSFPCTVARLGSRSTLIPRIKTDVRGHAFQKSTASRTQSATCRPRHRPFRARKRLGSSMSSSAHNSHDKPAVEAIASELRRRGLNPWFDKEQVPPGRWFQDVIQQAIPQVKSAAVILGTKGIGRWERVELRSFISQCVDVGLPVIPVLLPGVNQIPDDLLFLKELSWIRFKTETNEVEVLDALEWGITGRRLR